MSKTKLTEEQKEMASKLTSLQRKVVINVMDGMSHRKAYVKAGGKCKSNTSIDSTVSKMLGNVKVKAFYNSVMNTATENAALTKERAVQMLETMANVTIKDFYDFKKVCVDHDEAGEPVYASQWIIKNPEDMSDDVARCIKSYKIGKNGPELEIYSSDGALKQLSNMNGWEAPKKQELSGNLSVSEVTRKVID